jgi:hypothetical protein
MIHGGRILLIDSLIAVSVTAAATMISNPYKIQLGFIIADAGGGEGRPPMSAQDATEGGERRQQTRHRMAGKECCCPPHLN